MKLSVQRGGGQAFLASTSDIAQLVRGIVLELVRSLWLPDSIADRTPRLEWVLRAFLPQDSHSLPVRVFHLFGRLRGAQTAPSTC